MNRFAEVRRRALMPRLELCGGALLAFLAVIAPAFYQDDAALFNYMNNVTDPRPIYYYMDYLPIAPEIVGYLLRGLPFVVQAVSYRVLPLAMMLLLYRELLKLMRVGAAPAEASLLALAAMLILRAVDLYCWGNLTFVLWPAFLAALAYVLRINATGGRYSWWAVVGIVSTVSTLPVGVLLAIVMLANVRRGADPIRNRQNVSGGIAGLAGYALLNTRLLSNSVSVDPIAIVNLFRQGFTNEFRLANVVASLSAIVLGLATLQVLRQRRGGADTATILGAAFVGVGSFAGYLLSDRLASNDGGIGSYHALPVLLAALIVASHFVVRVADEMKRALLVGMLAGVASAGTAYEVYHHLRGPFEIALMKYRFLDAAQSFRLTCHEGDGMVFEDEDTSPIVLCRPRDFPVGHHPQTGFAPMIGFNDPDAGPNEHPFIYVGQPLF